MTPKLKEITWVITRAWSHLCFSKAQIMYLMFIRVMMWGTQQRSNQGWPVEQETDQSQAGAASWHCVMYVNGFVEGGWCHSRKQMVDVWLLISGPSWGRMQEEEYGKHSRRRGRMWPGPFNGEEDGVDHDTHTHTGSHCLREITSMDRVWDHHRVVNSRVTVERQRGSWYKFEGFFLIVCRSMIGSHNNVWNTVTELYSNHQMVCHHSPKQWRKKNLC